MSPLPLASELAACKLFSAWRMSPSAVNKIASMPSSV
eukprot:CAMPEP_0201133672 /NCGR_PEP_ID=MMETSP0850-20130426/49510_1 /ASSEMBLY_ACC=CAM_ASM_000622 /TAXON_ID=183588 /ORGANISM="Pseudo-nitzschia fraudulenta, Strain WWA7" /LENGTH=36 /DNA_ID= /DNA_START= /DNA_END= /DNA_ORIENTATION=